MKNLYITRKLPEQLVGQLRPYYKIVEWDSEDTVPPTPFTLAQIVDAMRYGQMLRILYRKKLLTLHQI